MSLVAMSLVGMSLVGMSLVGMSLVDLSLVDLSLVDLSVVDMSLVDMSLVDMSLVDLSLVASDCITEGAEKMYGNGSIDKEVQLRGQIGKAGLFSLEKRTLTKDLREVFKIIRNLDQ
eukprot:g33727.t1